VTDPLVCCILPFHRAEYVEQAIECFKRQAYPNRTLISLDTSKLPSTIGALRNQLVAMTPAGCLVAHFDYDDWSAPERLAEQVEFMRESGASVVGYRDMPFLDVVHDRVMLYNSYRPRGYAVGTSLLYRREVWERVPFPDAMEEDTTWQHQVGAEHIQSQSSVADGRPRMVARIHNHNTSPKVGARYEPASAELAAAVRACMASTIVAQ